MSVEAPSIGRHDTWAPHTVTHEPISDWVLPADEMRLFPQEDTVFEKRKLVMYDPLFDAQKYQAIFMLKRENPQLYEQKKAELDIYTNFNLKTGLGERYNAGVSRLTNTIKEGKIYGQGSQEPLMDIYLRGQKYRKENGSTPEDQGLESAEIVGFDKIQQVLADEQTPIGTMILFVSSPGVEGKTVYTHNFYDVFRLEERNGTRIIAYARFSSGLDEKESLEKLQTIDPSYAFGVKNVDGTYYRANPLKIDPYLFGNPNSEDVHAFMHKEHIYTSLEHYEKILEKTTLYRAAYLKALEENPFDMDNIYRKYNATVNKGDQIEGLLEKGIMIDETPVPHQTFIKEMYILEREEVEERGGGCGGSGGFKTDSETSAFSVSEFGFVGSDKYGDRAFSCPKCNKTNVRPENELIANCQHCGGDVNC